MEPMGTAIPDITPENTYDIDSEGFQSEQECETDGDTYERLLEEALEHGYSDDKVVDLFARLKERGLVNFLRDYLRNGAGDGDEPSLRKLLLSLGVLPPPHLLAETDDLAFLPYAKLALSRVLRHRQKLPHISTISDAIDLLRNAKKIIVLSGAGISTSCGIPDFRSANGLYAQLQADGQWELDEPQDMFDMRVFRERPEIFYSFAKQIYPSNFTPSPCHRWIKSLEDRGTLLRNYTQNIDTLESTAGVERVLQCHGSFSTASCLRCKTRVPGKTIEPYIMSQRVPHCGTCRQQRDTELVEWRQRKEAKRKSKGKGKAKAEDWDQSDSSEESEWGGGEPGIIKPDITFFGQALDSQFDECLYRDREQVDLLIIIGTSLKVAPVSEVLTHIPHSVPQIFINLTPVMHVKPDIDLIGDADTIVTYLSHQLGWDLPPPAAVVHSPGVDQPDVEHDTLIRPKREPLPPEEVAWISGSDDLQHIHLLTSKAALASRTDPHISLPSEEVPLQPTASADSAGSLQVPSLKLEMVEEVLDRAGTTKQYGEIEGIQEGSLEIDDDRPAKRSRVSTPVV